MLAVIFVAVALLAVAPESAFAARKVFLESNTFEGFELPPGVSLDDVELLADYTTFEVYRKEFEPYLGAYGGYGLYGYYSEFKRIEYIYGGNVYYDYELTRGPEVTGEYELDGPLPTKPSKGSLLGDASSRRRLLADIAAAGTYGPGSYGGGYYGGAPPPQGQFPGYYGDDSAEEAGWSDSLLGELAKEAELTH
ncbi:hypothetical protein Agub_g3511 [Astrephomene gubernaculifera]|uniref:Uncharacterized protein n=1 Tax=Astrephomene gubernaculifera TaxID=47775 RepID=A0AAD3DIQ0_9CHLO|nr:hypothetical protein Agub_g3511 [Astrephomene gubernaculifera]